MTALTDDLCDVMIAGIEQCRGEGPTGSGLDDLEYLLSRAGVSSLFIGEEPFIELLHHCLNLQHAIKSIGEVLVPSVSRGPNNKTVVADTIAIVAMPAIIETIRDHYQGTQP